MKKWEKQREGLGNTGRSLEGKGRDQEEGHPGGQAEQEKHCSGGPRLLPVPVA